MAAIEIVTTMSEPTNYHYPRGLPPGATAESHAIGLPGDAVAGASRPDDGSDGAHYDVEITIWEERNDEMRPKTVKVRATDVIRALGMNHALGEAFCALWRLGRKPGEDPCRALRKAKFYVEQELEARENKS